jgi:hypothetical protein
LSTNRLWNLLSEFSLAAGFGGELPVLLRQLLLLLMPVLDGLWTSEGWDAREALRENW